MSIIAVAAITDEAGGATATVNGQTPTASNSAGRNLVINGAFDVWQRGASFSGGAAYTSDRWKSQTNNNVGTTTRQTDAPEESRYSLKVAATGTGSFIQIGQQVEYANLAHFLGKEVTLSFWAKGTGITTVNSNILSANSTEDQTVLFSGSTLSTSALTINTSWQKFTHTFTIPSDRTAISVEFSTGDVVSGNAIHIGQVQLELGAVATPFEHKLYSNNLIECQRYYQFDSYIIWSGDVTDGGTYYMYKGFPVEMRAAPSIAYSGGGASRFPTTASSTNQITPRQLSFSRVANSTGGGGYYIENLTAEAEY